MQEITNILSKGLATAFRLCNVVVGGLLIARGIIDIVEDEPSFLVGFYTLWFGIIIVGMEIWPLKDRHKKFIFRYLGFLYSLLGRGLFYILIGLFTRRWYNWHAQTILGLIVGIIGAIYVVLAVVDCPDDLPPSMTPPFPEDSAWFEDPESRVMLPSGEDA